MKLTPKQQKFADYYIQTGSASESYKRAGYKNYKSAGVEANKTLKNPNVKKYIQEKNKEMESERIADMQEVREMWSKILRSQIDGVEIKDILKASEYIAKTNGAFLDKVEVTEKHIIVDIEEDDEE